MVRPVNAKNKNPNFERQSSIFSDHTEIIENKTYNMHIFHETCLCEWFLKKFECPLCRTEFYNVYAEFLTTDKEKPKPEQNNDIEAGIAEVADEEFKADEFIS